MHQLNKKINNNHKKMKKKAESFKMKIKKKVKCLKIYTFDYLCI